MTASKTMPTSQPIARDRQRWVLVATILGSSMAFIDSTVVNVALPVLQEDFHATSAEVQWVVEAYALFLSALILVGGSFGDRFGRRRIYMLGIGLFTLASIACGLAPNIGFLIAFRAVQGIGGALLTPGSLAIITAAYSGVARGRAIGTWSGFTSITTAFGPVLGGWLVEHASWRLIFFLNVPLAGVVLALCLIHVPESRSPQARGKLDWPGAALATVGLGGVVFGLIESSNLGLGSPVVLLAVLVGVAALVAFVAVEARSLSPMMPLRLFRSPTFGGTNVLTLFLYAGLGAATYFLPFNLIQVQGYSPTAAGAAFLPFVLLMFLLSRWSGGLIGRYGARLPLMVGPLIVAGGFVLFALPGIGGSYWTTFFPAVFALGLGMAIAVPPLTTAVMGAAGANRSGTASGINNAVARTASLLAIAVLGLVMLFAFSRALTSQASQLNLPPAAQQQLAAQSGRLAAEPVPASVPPNRRDDVRLAINESFIAGFRAVVLTCAGLAVASAVAAALLVRDDVAKGEASDTEGTMQA